MNNFLKWTIAKFMHSSEFEWDDILPLTAYCYITPSIDDLKDPFYLVLGGVPLKGILSNLQNLLQVHW